MVRRTKKKKKYVTSAVRIRSQAPSDGSEKVVYRILTGIIRWIALPFTRWKMLEQHQV